MFRLAQTNETSGSAAVRVRCALAWVVSFALGASGSAGAQTSILTRVSVDPSGAEADLGVGPTSISSDGRFVAFSTASTTLGAGDANATDDVYVHDAWTGTIERVSEPTGGGDANGPSTYPSLSEDGRFVVFSSWASNLVPNDTNNTNDVFLHDRELDLTTRLSASAAGVEGSSNSFLGTITPNGRFVTFLSFADNLVPGDVNQARDVFLVDRVLGTIELVSVGHQGQLGDGSSGGNGASAYTSPDGRYVAFTSAATNLVPGDTNFVEDVFLRDRVAATTRRLTLGPNGVEPDDSCEATALVLDGAVLGFTSAATNLVAGDTNGATDCFVLDVATGGIQRVSVSGTGAESTGSSWALGLSRDARFATFLSTGSDLVPNDLNGKRDVFVRDLLGLTTDLASVSDLGQQGGFDSFGSAFAADASALSFATASDNLVSFDTNTVSDAFRRDLSVGVAYCGGTTAPCPCANAVVGPSGCANATGRGGRLFALGRARLAPDTLTLVATGLPPGSSTMFLDGGALPTGGTGTQFGDGLRCLASPVRFLGMRRAHGGVARFGFENGDPLLSQISTVPLGGDYRRYQAWYRDAGAFCSAATFNWTNAVEILWLP